MDKSPEIEQTDTRAPAGGAIDAGNYEIIRDRLVAHARELSEKAAALNRRRQEKFGATTLTVLGNTRVRT